MKATTRPALCLLALLAILAGARSVLLAAPPSNDNFTSPVVLSGFPVSSSGSNVDATLELDEPLPDGVGEAAEASVWFRWTATTTGPVQVDTFGSDFDTILAVWEGNELIHLTQLAENDQFSGDQSALFIDVAAGITYQIAVYGWRHAPGFIALNISLDVTSHVSGTVTGPDRTTPLEGIQASAYRWNAGGGNWEWVSWDETDASGSYSIGGLAAGTYRVEFRDGRNGDYALEAYDNAADLDSGTDIVVPAETTVTGIDASLANASRITGTVTGPDGTTPLEGIDASAYRWNAGGGNWESVSWDETDANGSYTLGGLAAGTYRVEFLDWRNGDYVTEVYDDVADLDSGADIVVPGVTTVTGIDASLAKAPCICGTVTGPDGTTPLEGIEAIAHRWNAGGGYWEWVRSDATDASGNYSIGGLAAGTYRVEFRDGRNGDYLTEVYDDAADLDSGTDIIVPVETIVTGIDASLANASRITGTVTGPDGSSPLEGIHASAYRWNAGGGNWDAVSWDETDSNGSYSIGGLAAGTYRVEFGDWRNGCYVTEVYDDAADRDSGTDIVVPAETTVTGIDATLANAPCISGTVTGPDGTTPLKGILARAYRWNAGGGYWDGVSADETDAYGGYSIGGLAAGTYRVRFSDWWNGDYAPEVYDDAVDLDSGTDIVVPVETIVTGIDASLANASRITGTVTGPDGTTPLQGIHASAYRWNAGGGNWDPVSGDETDANGSYSIGGLAAGTYRVVFSDGQKGDYVPEVYDDAADLDSGTDIVVPTETVVTGIDVSLAKAPCICGTVTGPDGTTPLEGISASAYRWNASRRYWDRVSWDVTDTNGSYSIGGLAAGTYRVEFRGWWNGDYAPEVYHDAADLDSGTDIVVPAETIVTGIDASLAKASRITGTVTGPDGTTPLEGILADTYRWNAGGRYWQSVSWDATDANGSYSIGGLAAGTYRVRFSDGQNSDYLTEVYDDAADLDSGADIIVPVETTVTGIDASLANASGITGTVTGPDGTTPLEGIKADTYRWNAGGGNWGFISSDETDSSGSYRIGRLAAGTYRVSFSDWRNGDYVTEVYDDAADRDSGTDIVVPAETTVTGIDASLANASRIAGMVTGPDGNAPLEGIRARASRWNAGRGYWESAWSDDTDASGNYSIGGLVAGTYRVQFRDWQNGDYLTEVYADAVDLDSGTDIVVPAETTVTSIDASLATASRIAGMVTGSDGTTPLEGIPASAWSWNAGGGHWDWVSSDETDASGSYSIGGLAAGTYRVEFGDWRNSDYVTEVYDDAADRDSGTDIVVPAETTVTGIHASLVREAPPQPAVIVSIQTTGAGQFEVHYTGGIGQIYIIQESSSLSGWTDIGQHTCQSGVNGIPLTSSGLRMFWRLRTSP